MEVQFASIILAMKQVSRLIRHARKPKGAKHHIGETNRVEHGRENHTPMTNDAQYKGINCHTQIAD